MSPRKKANKTSIYNMANKVAERLQLLRRLEERDKDDMVKCVTCGVVKKFNDGMAGGHYIERGRLATKLDPRNVNPQCFGCNNFRMKTASGVLAYREYMVRRYGDGVVNEIEEASRHIKKYTREELNDLLVMFNEQIKFQLERFK